MEVVEISWDSWKNYVSVVVCTTKIGKYFET